MYYVLRATFRELPVHVDVDLEIYNADKVEPCQSFSVACRSENNRQQQTKRPNKERQNMYVRYKLSWATFVLDSFNERPKMRYNVQNTGTINTNTHTHMTRSPSEYSSREKCYLRSRACMAFPIELIGFCRSNFSSHRDVCVFLLHAFIHSVGCFATNYSFACINEYNMNYVHWARLFLHGTLFGHNTTKEGNNNKSPASPTCY